MLDWLLPAIVGVHLISAHPDESGYRTFTPGLYAKTAEGLTFGGYSNSLGQPSFYAGWTWEWFNQSLGLTVGGVTGYSRPLVLLVVPSGRLQLGEGVGLRLMVIPPIRQFDIPLTLSLSIEFTLPR